MPEKRKSRTAPGGASADDAVRVERRRTHIGRLLVELSARFERDSLARMRSRGHPELTQAQMKVIVQMPIAGARLTDLAGRMGVTKQAAMKLVDGLESLDYLRRDDDPEDQRAKRVTFTRRGRRLLDDGLAVVAELEGEWRAVLGAPRFDGLCRALRELADGIDVTMPDPTSTPHP